MPPGGKPQLSRINRRAQMVAGCWCPRRMATLNELKAAPEILQTIKTLTATPAGSPGAVETVQHFWRDG